MLKRVGIDRIEIKLPNERTITFLRFEIIA